MVFNVVDNIIDGHEEEEIDFNIEPDNPEINSIDGESEEREEDANVKVEEVDLTEFDDSTTVAEILQILEGDGYGDFDLSYNGRILQRHTQLRLLDIPRDAKIIRVDRKMTVNVRNCGTGINIPAIVNSSDTVRTLRDQINERGSSTVRANRISFDARELNDCDTLRSHGIKDGAQLYASPNLVGG